MHIAVDQNQIYEALAGLPRFGPDFAPEEIPANGIYLFFERGEARLRDNNPCSRIVRVGTHRVDGRLRTRIRSHYQGNTRGSVFRRHLGLALLEAGFVERALVETQKSAGYKHPPALESAITNRMIGYFCFSVIPVEHREDRLRLEAGLIATLAFDPIGRPSASWLGNHSPVTAVRESGLWNRQHVNGPPLDSEDFELLLQQV